MAPAEVCKTPADLSVPGASHHRPRITTGRPHHDRPPASLPAARINTGHTLSPPTAHTHPRVILAQTTFPLVCSRLNAPHSSLRASTSQSPLPP